MTRSTISLLVHPTSPGNLCRLPPALLTSTSEAALDGGTWALLSPNPASSPGFQFVCRLQTVRLTSYATLHGPRIFCPSSEWKVPALTDGSATSVPEMVLGNVDIQVLGLSPDVLDSVHVSVLSVKSTHAPALNELDAAVRPLVLANELAGSVVAPGFIVETDDYLVRVDNTSSQVFGRISPALTEVSVTESTPASAPASVPPQPASNPIEPALSSPAGLESVYTQLTDLIAGALLHADLYTQLGTRPPRGILLHGPPGVGKTWLVSCAARAMHAQLLAVGAQDILSPFPGDSERNLRRVFSQALSHAQAGTPVVLFLDEIDAIAPHRAGASSAMARVVAQLLTLMDGMDKDRQGLTRLVVVGATNRPNGIDPAVRRPGRLDREVSIPPPPAPVRRRILESMLEKVPTAPDVVGSDGAGKWLARFAECLPGYVGADLAALVREACQGVVQKRLLADELALQEPVITREDLMRAQAKVPPSLRRGHQVQLAGGRATSWSDIGGLDDVKAELIRAAVWPIERSDQFRALGLHPPRGLLLYGPPGCSKTTLVRVLASELRSAFYSLTPAEVYSAFVGEAERIVRAAFARARATAPSVLFLDELDALVGGERDQGDGVKHRVLLTLLAEMDGVESGANDDPARAVLVVAATNHPDQLDAALVRPGRLDRTVYVRPPTRQEKVAIFDVFTKRMPLSPEVDLDAVVDRIPLATGADIESICREAALASLREGTQCVQQRHFVTALESCHPVVTPAMLEYYEHLSKRFK